MSWSSIHVAFDTRFDALSFPQGLKIFAGKVSQPNAHQPRLEGRMVSVTRRPVGPGGDTSIEWVGTYQVSVYFPINFGRGPVDDQVDLVMAHFPRGSTLSTTDGQSISILNPQPSRAVDMPAFVMVPVDIGWQSYEV